MKRTKDLSILVTGGGSGIGEGIARYFVASGARVTICGRREDKLDAVQESLGANCISIVGDVTIAADREAIVSGAVEHGGKLDALISNAGNMLRGNIDELSQEALLEIYNTNVVAGMLLTGLCKPHLSKTDGAVIFMGSVHNRRAFPGASAYAGTKGALEALTRVLAAELGPENIRVNCIVPGAVPTEINQRAGVFTEDESDQRYQRLASSHVLGRIGSTTEIAEAVDYLVRAEWTTGAVLDVDGGLGLGLTND